MLDMARALTGLSPLAIIILAAVAVCTVWSRYRLGARRAVRPPFKYQEFEGSGWVAGRRVVAVTGGCGFVGRRIVQLMLESDEDVNVIVLDLMVPVVRDARVKYIRCDITDAAQVEQALRGADSVIHTAGILPTIATLPSVLHAVNVGGTKNVMKACEAHNIEAMVYTSTATVALDLHGGGLFGVDETHPVATTCVDGYANSKKLAEKEVLGANTYQKSNGLGLATCVLRPGAVFGEGDLRFSDSLSSGESHVLIGEAKVHMDIVHVDNVAQAHVLAERAMRTKREILGGQVYFIGSCFDKKTPTHDLGEFIGRGPAGQRDHWDHRRPMTVPIWLLFVFAYLNQFLWDTFGVAFNHQFVPASMVYATRTYYFDCAKARAHFGYTAAVSIQTGIERVMTAIREGKHISHSPKARIQYQ
eukprot:m.280989 g.280989  ORF g.280989 m.280989 type:complete len:417 (+) comp54920_c0_seq5:1-1251(+)